jgi:hypothetical protein
MSAAVDVAVPVPSQTVQRKCSDGPCACGCAKEPEHGATIRRQPATGGYAAAGPAAPATAARIGASRGGGAPLPPAARAPLESSFGGRDFSAVRVHSDPSADALARSMHAQAFTVGNDIFFAAHRYDPASLAGQRLLAHELTHVVQQGGSAASAMQPKLEIGAANAPAEAEADRIAEAVVSGRNAGPIGAFPGATIRRAGGPGMPSCPEGTQQESADDVGSIRCVLPNGDERVVLSHQKPFQVSRGKVGASPDLSETVARYQAYADAKHLQNVHEGRSATGSDPWPAWRGRRAPAVVQAAKTQGLEDKCSPDHVIELQVGGGDSADNLRLLDRERNRVAGSQLDLWLGDLRRDYFGTRRPKGAILQFTAAAAATDKRFTGVADSKDPCLEFDAKNAATGGPKSNEKEFPEFDFGGQATHVRYRNDETREVVHQSKAAVAGFELKKVIDPSESGFSANISEKIRHIPFLKGTFADFKLLVEPSGAKRAVKFDKTMADIVALQMYFPGMSNAVLIPRLEHGEYTAAGDFTPTLFLLRYTTMHLEVKKQSLSATLRVTPDKIKQALPIPGLTIDPVTLTISVIDGAFSAAGLLGFKYGKLMTGSIDTRWQNGALLGDGIVELHIPGIDKAEGQVHLRNGRFTGSVNVRKDKFKLPGVRDANLTAAIDENAILTGSGSVGLEIPGLQHPTLLFTCNSQGNYAIAGSATASIPGVKDARIAITYANGAFSGRGHAGFAIPGLDTAGIDLVYANGQFSGSGSVDFRKGKLGGHLQINLSPAHKLNGGGDLQYEIAPGLVAIVGMQVREDGSTHVQGELRLPDPLEIFPAKEFKKRLFGVSIDIPIFGISFGSTSVGVIANLTAAVNASAGVGPGQIRHSKIIAAFDPMKDLAAATFRASAELYVPAHAEIAIVLSGGIGVSLLIVKAIGGISATGEVGLMGALAVPIDLKYIAGKFSVNGAAELFAQPRVRFHLDAFVKVQADLLVTTIDVYTKEWKLAAFEWGSDFKIGVRFPVHYTFGEPFTLSLNQLEFIAPQVDARKLVHDLLPK